MAVTASTVNTTDTLETLRLQYNNLKSDVTSIDDTVTGGGSSVAADNITAGDAAVSIATTTGNITIDAQGSDTDIIFKGTDGASDITALTIDMSDAGTATFNNDVVVGNDLELTSDSSVIVFGTNSDVKLTHVHNTGLTLTHAGTTDNLPVVFQLKSEEDAIIANEVIASLEFAAGDSDGTDGATVAAGIHAIAEGTFSASANATKLVFTTGVSETAAASATAKMTLSSAGLLTIADDFVIKDGGTIGSASDKDAISIASGGDVTFTQDIIIAAGGSRTSSGQTENILITNSNSTGDDTGIHMTAGNTGNSTIRFGAPGDDTLSSIQATNDTTSATLKLAAGNGNTNLTLSGTSGSELAVFSGNVRIKDGGTIGAASSTSAITIASSGIVTFVDDILIKDGGTIGAASATTAITIASSGIVTFVDDIIIKDGGTIGSASDTDALSITSAGNIGINTTSPAKKLSVNGPALATISALSDGATITPDFDTSQNFSVTLGGNRTLANPNNIDAGQTGSIFVTQDGTGSRTLAFGNKWAFAGGTAPTLTTTAAAVDRIDYIVMTASIIQAVVSLDVKVPS